MRLSSLRAFLAALFLCRRFGRPVFTSAVSAGCLLHLRLLLRKLGRLELLPVESDLGDADGGVVLAMSAQLLVLLLALVMENEDFRAAALLRRFRRSRARRIADGDLPSAPETASTSLNSTWPSVPVAWLLHSNHIAGRHPVLLTTGADDRVHTHASVKTPLPRRTRALRESADFLCLLCVSA